MTRPVPVAVPAPGLPLADPTDRATYAARKLEHLRWEKEDLAPGVLALAQVAKDNADDANVNAIAVAADAATSAANAALAALYAGAALWVSGTTYGLGVLARSPANGRVYNKITGTAGGVVDPSANSTDWSPVSITTPIQVVAGLVQQAISGGAYAATNTTAQAAATNLLLYSLQFDQAAWVKASSTVSADFTMSPTGNVDADKLVEAAATAAHNVSQVVTAAANVVYTFSVEVKAAGRTTIALSMDRDSGMADYVKAKFDLSGAGASSIAAGGTGSGASATCTHLGNGFYLCTLTGTPSTTAGTTVRSMLHLSDFNSSYLGNGTNGVAMAEAQLETGNVPTSSRIATGAATAARAASLVAPTRFIAPATPAADAFWEAAVQNGIETNVVDLNGATFYGQSGIVKLDNAYLIYEFQYVNGTWRFV